VARFGFTPRVLLAISPLTIPHCLDRRLLDRPLKLEGEQAIVQLSLADLDPVGEPETPLEMSRSDAPVKIIVGALFQLLAADDQLAVLDGDRKLIDAEASDGERDAKHVSCGVTLRQDLNVVGRVTSLGPSDEVGKRTVGPGATKPDFPFRERHTRHSAKPFHSKRLRHVVAFFGPYGAQTKRKAQPVAALSH
jgi:hypothetical protein